MKKRDRWLLLCVVGTVAGCAPGSPGATGAPRPRDSTAATLEGAGARSASLDSTARRGVAMNMADLLIGRVPGLEVRKSADGRISLRVRGNRSAAGEPLIVLDGIPMEADNNSVLQDIDPREVASVRVVTDAGSLAEYGSRGANGVVLITTKR